MNKPDFHSRPAQMESGAKRHSPFGRILPLAAGVIKTISLMDHIMPRSAR